MGEFDTNFGLFCQLIFLEFYRKVIDIESGAGRGHNIITWGKHGGENQQWFVNSDETIVSVSGNLALDICEGKYSAGNRIIAHPRHGGDNQKFHLQYQ